MRRLLVIALAILLVPSVAMARGHGGSSGGHSSGGAHMSGGWSHHGPSSMSSGARMNSAARVSGLSSGMGTWKGGNWKGQGGNWKANWSHNGHRHHRHNRIFVVGGPWWGGYYDNAYYDDGCWQWVETRRGLRRIWACGDYY